MSLLLGVGPCEIGLRILLVLFNRVYAIIDVGGFQVFELESANEVNEGRLCG